MVVIQKKKGETKDAIFRKFSRMFMDENIVDELRKKQYYKKPSLRKKDEAKERIRLRARRRRFALSTKKERTAMHHR
jgi:small subunit ribosomal protein S21